MRRIWQVIRRRRTQVQATEPDLPPFNFGLNEHGLLPCVPECVEFHPAYFYRDLPNGQVGRSKVIGHDPDWLFPITLNRWEEVEE